MRHPVLITVLAVPSLLGLLAGCSSADEPAATAAASPTASESADSTALEPAEFGYTGEEGPTHWAELSPGYVECADATAQSPIDLTGATGTTLTDPVFAYTAGPVELTNTGHSVQLAPQKGSTLTLDGHRSELAQIHLHEPSEHTVDGVLAAGELHLVHKDADGKITVVAVLLTTGAENPALAPYLSALPAEVDGTATLDTFDIAALLPASRASYRYTGSLTTPPCTEGVQWVVLQQPVQVSAAQLAAFRDVIVKNNRPVQPVGDRALVLDGADS
ncbi:carbonic anhydrase [Cellulomonas soli]|uniref:carbonic anhydrase n=1 Tax=Cellulomonas soli TaxID=931535 RepID=UPI003F829471